MEEHDCINKEKVEELERRIVELQLLLNNRVTFLTILSLIVSPKMIMALCLGVAFIIQILKGG